MSSNPLYNPQVFGSSSTGGTLTLSGVGPGTPGGNVLINPDGGQAGIATSNPSNVLSVNGTADFSGNVGIGTVSPGSALDVQGDVSVNGQLTTTGQASLAALDVPGNVTVGGQLTTTGQASLAALGVQGNVTVGGQLTTAGQVSLSENLIDTDTIFAVLGWGNTTMPSLAYSNGVCSSSGGVSVNSQAGFAQTYGGGNYGYFAIDLGQCYSGLLSVYCVAAVGNGFGLWNIICSQQAISTTTAVTNFTSDSTATQIWQLYQALGSGNIFYNNNQNVNVNIVPIQVTVYFNNARSFYIGAIDQNQGQLCLQLNNISVVPLVLG